MRASSGLARSACAAVFGALFALAPRARAQVLGPEGSQIRTNNYAVDLYQGPVLASSRVTGLAGAYVAIAEGTDGNPQNPAAPALRVPWSFDHFDYDLGLSFTLPTALPNGDFWNSGSNDSGSVRTKNQDLFFLNFAANVQLGSWGFGLTADFQQYGLDRQANAATDTGNDKLRGQFGVAHLIMARSFSDGQLLFGAGVRTTALSVGNKALDRNNQLFSTTGAGFQAGVLWRPNDQRVRVGAAVHSAVTTQPDKNAETQVLYPGTGTNELWLPERIILPWDVNVGVAVQLGPRPFNPRWYDPSELLARVRRSVARRAALRARHRELLLARVRAAGLDEESARAAIDAELETQATLDAIHLQEEEARVDRILRKRVRDMARSYVLISSSLLITGKAANAVGVESFLERTVDRSGKAVVLSPRLGAESELVPSRLKLRAGSYVEPTRFESSAARVHGTFGFDVKLLPWSVFGLFRDDTEWRVSAAIDASARYFSSGLSLGIWH